MDWTGWPGPHDIRLPAHRTITADVAPGTQVLLVVENRQAAETICDTHPEIAVIWCHGQPPDPLLDLINQAAIGVSDVVICPDADLGAGEHDQGEPFSVLTRDRIAATAERTDAVGVFTERTAGKES